MKAPATSIPMLGVKQGESWNKIGTTFAIIITIVTAIYLWASYGTQLIEATPSIIFLSIIIALPLSFINSLTEGIITRWSIVEGLSRNPRLATLAPWISALLFGSAHYFGIPGGFIGSIMAGFLAWFLTRSIQDTNGIGWSWLIHFIQDVLIFSVTISIFIINK